METMIDNLINGNVTDACKQAKRHSKLSISNHLHNDLGWSADRSRKAAEFLKTGKGFQEYCDAE